VFERGWLSSNNILLRPPEGCGPSDAAVLIDSGHSAHAEQTLALHGITRCRAGRWGPVGEHAPAFGPLRRQCRCCRHHGTHRTTCGAGQPARRPCSAGIAEALSYAATGQRCDRLLVPTSPLWAGETMHTWAGQRWVSLAAPGPRPARPDALARRRRGAGRRRCAVGERLRRGVSGAGRVWAPSTTWPQVLDLIETLPVRWVIPGHGAAFTDVAGALQRARRRLAAHRADAAAACPARRQGAGQVPPDGGAASRMLQTLLDLGRGHPAAAQLPGPRRGARLAEGVCRAPAAGTARRLAPCGARVRSSWTLEALRPGPNPAHHKPAQRRPPPCPGRWPCGHRAPGPAAPPAAPPRCPPRHDRSGAPRARRPGRAATGLWRGLRRSPPAPGRAGRGSMK
jgi:hypothetical protein